MQIVAIKFLLIFCIAWFNGNNVNCDVRVVEGDVDDSIISEIVKVMLQDWRKNNTMKKINGYAQPLFTYDFKCRSESYLYMKFTYSTVFSNDEQPPIHTLKIQNVNGEMTERRTILTDERFVNVSNLQANNTYSIKFGVFPPTENFRKFDEYKFTTLPIEYTPDRVTRLRLKNDRRLNYISWFPNEDEICFYNVIIFSPFDEVEVYFDGDVQCCYITVPNITAINFLEVHVQGINQVHNKLIKGEIVKNIFDMPHLKNNKIHPRGTEILQVTHTHKYDNVFSMNVSWDATRLYPAHYMLRILDLDRNLKQILARVTLNTTIKEHFINLSNVTLNGTEYEVHLVHIGDTGTKDTYYFISRTLESDNTHVTPITSHNTVLIVIPVIVILAVALLILIIFHRRSNRKLHQEELAKKVREELENSLFINDEMEIDRDNVLILDEVLGEGAFGLVRKGLLKLNDTSECEVAVKMLKDNAGIDDIKEFHSEIEVMKLVGAHPNIVRIIGHFTRNASEMLLIAEYCSQGNLLVYLRAEWHYVYRRKSNASSQQEKKCSTVQLLNDNQADTTLNFDKKVVSFENMKDSNRELSDISQSTDPDKILPTQFVVNKCCTHGEFGDEVRASKENLPIPTETNETDCGTSSGKSDLDSCERVIELKSVSEELDELVLPEKETYNKYPKSGNIDQPISRKKSLIVRNNPLTSGDLLRITKQIAQGMVFLSKNRVVHRDLAARNVLVCEDNTVKISDFGLSRDIYAENMYKKSGNGKLPIKWLALESMSHGLYTTQSDVWSYGILLYEIVTLGGTPYPLVPVDELLNYLKRGERMEKPNNCSQALYDLMKSCWNANPTERPTFTNICKIIDEMLTVTHVK